MKQRKWRTILPMIVLVAGGTLVYLGNEWPMAFVVLLMFPPTFLLIGFGMIMIWWSDFLVASAICGAITAFFLSGLVGMDSATLLGAACAWLMPFAFIQLLFFRRSPRWEKIGP